MAVTISGESYVLINACEDATQWTDGVPDDVSDFFKEGTQCVGTELWGSGDNDTYITGSWDLSGAKHLRLWFMTTVLKELNTDANGGIQIYVGDGANTGYYYVSGSTTYPGGWYNMVLDLSRDVSSGTKPDMSAITTIGIRCNLTAGAKKTQSMWVDHLCLCDGLVAYGDDGGNPFNLDDVYDGDNATTLGIGVLTKVGGVFFSKGSLRFGDNSNSCKFKDEGQILVFEDSPVSGELYRIEVIEGSAQSTEFQLGNKSGTQGIQGCTIIAAGDQDWNLYCSGETVDKFNLYGSTFGRAKWVELAHSGEKEVLSCGFQDAGSGEVAPNGINFTYSNIINPTDVGIAITDYGQQMPSDCNFIACKYAIKFNVSGEFTLTNDTFTNNTYDIWNNSEGSLTINCSNSNAQTYSGENVTITNTKYHRVTNVVENSEVTYVSGEGDSATVLAHEENVGSDGISQYDYNYTGDFEVDILIMHLSYEPYQQTITLSSADTIFPVSQVFDRNYSNP